MDGEKYIGSTTVDFTIEKATVTITAANKSAVVGSAQPELTYISTGILSVTVTVAILVAAVYLPSTAAVLAITVITVSTAGLADGETLTTAPTLTCTPDMNTVGSYPITASGAAVSNGGGRQLHRVDGLAQDGKVDLYHAGLPVVPDHILNLRTCPCTLWVMILRRYG